MKKPITTCPCPQLGRCPGKESDKSQSAPMVQPQPACGYLARDFPRQRARYLLWCPAFSTFLGMGVICTYLRVSINHAQMQCITRPRLAPWQHRIGEQYLFLTTDGCAANPYFPLSSDVFLSGSLSGRKAFVSVRRRFVRLFVNCLSIVSYLRCLSCLFALSVCRFWFALSVYRVFFCLSIVYFRSASVLRLFCSACLSCHICFLSFFYTRLKLKIWI